MTLNDIPRLTQALRSEAKTRAKARVADLAGKRPTWADYRGNSQGEYPAWLTALIVSLSLVVLATAFMLSAIRLYHIGYTTFYATISHERSAGVAGVAIILMAEAAAVLFTLSLSVIKADKASWRILVLSTVATASLALSGNYMVALSGHDKNIFTVLEAMLPPMLTLSTAYVLKQLLLNTLKARYAQLQAFWGAEAEWKAANNESESHPQWLMIYANELRDGLIKAHSRRKQVTALLTSLTEPQWAWLIRREMASDDWFDHAVNSDEFELISQNEASRHEQSNDAQNLTDLANLSGLTKPTPKRDLVIEHLKENPEDMGLTVRQLGERVGVSSEIARQGKIFFQRQNEDTQPAPALEEEV